MPSTEHPANKVHVGLCDNCGEHEGDKKLARWGKVKMCHACQTYQNRTGKQRPVGVLAKEDMPSERSVFEVQQLQARYAAQKSYNTKLVEKLEEMEEKLRSYRRKLRKARKLLDDHGIDY